MPHLLHQRFDIVSDDALCDALDHATCCIDPSSRKTSVVVAEVGGEAHGVQEQSLGTSPTAPALPGSGVVQTRCKATSFGSEPRLVLACHHQKIRYFKLYIPLAQILTFYNMCQ